MDVYGWRSNDCRACRLFRLEVGRVVSRSDRAFNAFEPSNFKERLNFMNVVKDWFAGTILLIGLFLVLKNASQFSEGMKSLTEFYTGSVKALQGR